jgi:Muconolactone delta-isomerase
VPLDVDLPLDLDPDVRLPLFPYMTIQVTPLAQHPSGPCRHTMSAVRIAGLPRDGRLDPK